MVIETSSTPNGPKISTEIHSFDPTSNTMYSNFLIHQTGEVSRGTGAVNIEERRVNWTFQLNSNTEEKRRLDLTVTFDNKGLSATLVGAGIPKRHTCFADQRSIELGRRADLLRKHGAKTAEELKTEGK